MDIQVRNASSIPNVVFQIVFESMYQVKQFKKKIPGYEEIFAVEVAPFASASVSSLHRNFAVIVV